MLIPGSARLKNKLLLPSTCIVMVSFLALSPLPKCVSKNFYLCCLSNESGSFVLPVTSFPLPPPPPPFPTIPSVMFSIFWECQCATC